jgi:transcriptional regulator with XRE-family HTH domain
MTETSPVNPQILYWARTTAGLSVDDVVQKLKRKKITSETVLAWESGQEAPDYIQLERLAYEVYKRPLASPRFLPVTLSTPDHLSIANRC